ncbi:MAG: hypothetical protein KKB62_00705 [Nanoarchaeota archaeon]|nr:hypothetical protein [Nanoarchaeota archaeon]
MEEIPPEGGLPFLEWYRDLYKTCVDCFEDFFEMFPFFEDYKKCLASMVNEGINSCNEEITNYLTSSGDISYEFFKSTLKRIGGVEKMMDKIDLQRSVVSKHFNSLESWGFSQN